MSWIIDGTHIAVREGTTTGHLEAIDVWDAINSGTLLFNGVNQGSVEDAFPEIWFSSISVSAIIHLYSEMSELYLDVLVKTTSVDFVSGILLDQVLYNNEWHYIENASTIRDILQEAGISAAGNITAGTYLKLINKSMSEPSLFLNEVDSESLKSCCKSDIPKTLMATLYPYQKAGFSWMDQMLDDVTGCILGDEMGVGKTLQAIALICKRASNHLKCLVVAPVSLLDNWLSECNKFSPNLNVMIHHGIARTGNPKEFDNYDLIITSYGNAVTDNLLLCQVQWELLILDEAQYIKNPGSSRTLHVKEIPANQRLAITGTPFENHITDIWSLVDFILPGFLGEQSAFKASYTDDAEGAEALEPILSALMVRRLVDDVASDLPDKIIIAQPLTMTVAETEAYEEIRQNIEKSGQLSLAMLQKLRMYCTHPFVFNGALDGDPAECCLKYHRTCEILEEIFERNEKVLIFTSYQNMFDIFLQDIPNRFHVPANMINGTTPVSKRQQIVNAFNEMEGSALLVLNPRAAGTGLNITGANHVIHYNPEWNPAIEDQASARAYRRGQMKPTFIYRLYYLGTVEEIINERLEHKRDIASRVVVGSDGENTDLHDIEKALKLSPKGRK